MGGGARRLSLQVQHRQRREGAALFRHHSLAYVGPPFRKRSLRPAAAAWSSVISPVSGARSCCQTPSQRLISTVRTACFRGPPPPASGYRTIKLNLIVHRPNRISKVTRFTVGPPIPCKPQCLPVAVVYDISSPKHRDMSSDRRVNARVRHRVDARSEPEKAGVERTILTGYSRKRRAAQALFARLHGSDGCAGNGGDCGCPPLCGRDCRIDRGSSPRRHLNRPKDVGSSVFPASPGARPDKVGGSPQDDTGATMV